MKKSLITVSVAALAALALVGCSTTNSSTQASNNTTKQMTVKTDTSLAMLPDSYFQANATVDKFLNDWLTLDSKDGIQLLDSNAKQGKTAMQLEQYFAQFLLVIQATRLLDSQRCLIPNINSMCGCTVMHQGLMDPKDNPVQVPKRLLW